jgi:signal transduction histidine kinase
MENDRLFSPHTLFSILDTAGMGVGVFDADDRLVYANPVFLDALATQMDVGATWESIMRRCHRDRVGLLIESPDIEPWLARVRLQFRKKPLRSFDSDLVDGRWMRTNESVDAEGCLFVTMTDITSLKINEAALQQARDNAVQMAKADIEKTLVRQVELNRLKSNFVAMTSHEFRTPLATILSSSELLKYYGDRFPADERADLTRSIEASVERMTQMLDKILRIGKSEAGMLEFNPQPLNLHALCHSMLREIKNQHPHCPCELIADLDADASSGLFDEKLLRHVFLNLLSNALKYSPTGGEVRLTLYRSGDATVFEVSDQGIGIPEESIANLFEPFYRGRNVGNIHGTGLGLVIVKSSVELHGGQIRVESRMGKGSRFVVRFGAQAHARGAIQP